MKNVLITGIAGFVGANLSRLLLADGNYKVYGIDNFSTGDYDNVPKEVKMMWGSISNFDKITDTVYFPDAYFNKGEAESIDIIIHLAADSGVKPSVENPLKNAHENVMGTLNMLEFARRNRVDKFIFASSGGTILGAQEPPVHEDSPIKPISPYGASKASCEHYCNAYNETFGLNTTIVRFSNVYGPYSLHKEKNLIPAFLLSCMYPDRYEFQLFGNGEQTRDFIYVDDLVDALCKIIENDDKYSGETFQIATGEENPINYIIDRMNIYMNNKFGIWKEINPGPKQLGDVEKNYALINKAKKYLDWQPKYSVEEGIEKLFDFYL